MGVGAETERHKGRVSSWFYIGIKIAVISLHAKT